MNPCAATAPVLRVDGHDTLDETKAHQCRGGQLLAASDAGALRHRHG
jgi:hypothetical protein